MSSPTHLKRGFAAAILAAVLAFAAVPAAVQAAPVNLATANPFVVLGGTTVTNTGPSVLNGDLGVAPGTALTGFGLPAVVNGATDENDGVAKQAQSDLTNAYNVAAGQPVAPADDLSGTNLGNRKLGPGAYRYTSEALLTGPLTLDAEGDRNAQFVFEIGSELTTASASSVVLVNGASPCNVYWQVGSSATLGTTTAFEGNLMALTSISLKNGASVIGRMLARNGQVSLIDNVLTRPLCATGSTPSPTVTPPNGPTAIAPAASGKKSAVGRNRAVPVSQTKAHGSTRRGTAVVRPAPREACTSGFRATVSGHMIKRVVFSLDGKPMASRNSSPFAVSVRAAPGAHQVSARVTFKDATPAKTMALPYRACAAAVLHPRHGPSQFTG
ncbi:MAG TPA: ice-binding family protein [Solirubrobacterales bacterium]